MPLVLANRVQETTTTIGTGTVTLAGAVSGYQSFATIGNGNTTYYALTSGSAWEVGIGTYTSSGTTLSRDTVLSSSAAGSKITLSGTSNAFVTYPSEDSVYQDGSDIKAGSAVLGVANGGTGQTTYTNGQLLIGNTTGNTLTKATLTAGTNISITNGSGAITVGLTGTVAVGNGGTGATTLTLNNVLLGNGTSAVQAVAPGTSSNVLTSNGTTWVSQAPAASGVSQARATALAMVFGL